MKDLHALLYVVLLFCVPKGAGTACLAKQEEVSPSRHAQNEILFDFTVVLSLRPYGATSFNPAFSLSVCSYSTEFFSARDIPDLYDCTAPTLPIMDSESDTYYSASEVMSPTVPQYSPPRLPPGPADQATSM